MVRGNSYKTTQWPSNLEDTGRSANHHPPHALLSPPSPPPPPHFGALLGAGPFPFSCWPTLLWQVVEWEGPRGMSGADLVQADTFSTRPVSTQHVQNTKHSSFTQSPPFSPSPLPLPPPPPMSVHRCTAAHGKCTCVVGGSIVLEALHLH